MIKYYGGLKSISIPIYIFLTGLVRDVQEQEKQRPSLITGKERSWKTYLTQIKHCKNEHHRPNVWSKLKVGLQSTNAHKSTYLIRLHARSQIRSRVPSKQFAYPLLYPLSSFSLTRERTLLLMGLDISVGLSIECIIGPIWPQKLSTENSITPANRSSPSRSEREASECIVCNIFAPGMNGSRAAHALSIPWQNCIAHRGPLPIVQDSVAQR